MTRSRRSDHARLLSCIAVLLAPALAFAQPKVPPKVQPRILRPEAQSHVNAGRAAFKSADYAKAAEEFERAYAIDDDPALLYAEAQARRNNHECSAAAELYRRYLSSNPPADSVASAKEAIATCKPVEAATPPPAPPPEVPRAPVVPPSEPRQPEPPAPEPPAPGRPVPVPTRTSSRPLWYRDALGDALALSGAAAIGTAIWADVVAGNFENSAKTAVYRNAFVRSLSESNTHRDIAAVTGIAGAALLSCGIVRYVLHDSLHGRELVAGTNGTTLFIAGSL